jgi:glutamine cyclotransferase
MRCRIFTTTMRFIYTFLLFLLFAACGNNDTTPDTEDPTSTVPAPSILNVQLVTELKHDTGSFTEGFNIYEGQFYESTGSPEEPSNNGSWFGPIDPKTGKFTKAIVLDTQYFGEGTTFLKGKLYQITWKNQRGFVYDAKTFKKLREFSYKGDGWGLTNDGKNLIMSAGNSNLYYLDPDSLRFVKMLAVQDNTQYVSDLNELEYIDGFIYANVWLKSTIVKIDPATGYVVAKANLDAIQKNVEQKFPGASEMNGIAYDSTTKKTYITGKKWPVIYEIKW